MHRINIEVSSVDPASRGACNEVEKLIQAHMIGVTIGASRSETSTGMLYEIEDAVLNDAFEDLSKERSRPIELIGRKLLTDNHELVNAIGDATSSADRSQRLADNFPYLISTTRRAINVLEEKRFAVEEIHVYGGRVRAMAGERWGRMDSGWFEIAVSDS